MIDTLRDIWKKRHTIPAAIGALRDIARKIWKERHTIPAANVPTYKATREKMDGLKQKIAPEVFRVVGWSAAIGALEIVRRKTGSSTLVAVNVVLFVAVLWHIVSFFAYWSRKETEMPNGDLQLEEWSRGKIVAHAIAVLMSWGLAFLVAIVIPRQIAAAELFGFLK